MNVDVVAVDFPPFERIQLRSGAIVRLHYLFWQVLVARVARTRNWLDGVDLAHHVTYATDWQPAGLIAAARRVGVPSFLGPVSGGPTAKASALPYYSMRGRLGWLIRRLYKPLARRCLAASSIKRADLVTALNRETAELLAGIRNKPVGIMPNFVMPANLRGSQPSANREEKAAGRHLMLAGRLHSWKGPYLALATMERLGPNYSLTIIGSGPEASGIRRAAHIRGLSERVRILQQESRADFLSRLASVDCLFHPSFEDSCPGVVGEAISLGTPVVALDRGGTAELRDLAPGAAVFLACHSAEDLPGELARAVELAAAHAGRIGSRAFEPNAFSERLQEVYQSTLDEAAR